MTNFALTIGDLHKDLISKKYSVNEIVEFYFQNIKKTDKRLNSFLTLNEKAAIARSIELDKLLAKKGKEIFIDYPLFGVGVSHKDLFLTKGLRTTAASKVLENYIPQYSSTVVNRLDSAGTITLGKLNCDAWAHGSSGENSDFGATKNPWNNEYVPGGSSSGSGTALAANFSMITTGTDTCGSVRLPANFCGVYGLKPTYGSVSRYGVVAMASSLDSIGHFARSARDIEKVLKVTNGKDDYDSTLDEQNVNLTKNKLRIGLPKEFFGDGLDPEVRKTVESAVKVYEKMDYDITEVTLPSTKYAISVYYIVQPAEVSSNLGRYDGIRYGDDRQSFGDEAKRRIMLGTYVLSSGYYDAYYLKAMKVRSIIINEVDKAFNKVDALIAPVAPTPPFKLGEKTENPLEMYLTDMFAATANLSGIPALAVPHGFTQSGLPLGFQLMAKRFNESVLIKMAKDFENETNYLPKVINNQI
jgi:aspartyl-tRNA(Asn)/glutamyl-tRNA(Gln) amidotransferase subunit A